MDPYTFRNDPQLKTFNNYLRERFQARVYRVPIDAGFTCPNRDGVRAFGGCTFCDDRGSGAPTIAPELSVQQQLRTGIERVRKRFKAQKFLAYFQAFTNTYAPEASLRRLYDVALAEPDVVGLCIGTRPDCLEDNILDMLAEYHEKTFVWLEVGLQTAVNRTLDAINRGHSAEEFFDAVSRAQKRGLFLATHLIFGLPGETRDEMLDTVRKVAASGVQGVKIHQLCVYKGTPMATQYENGEFQLLSEEDYVELVADALELLSPDQIVMRLIAEGPAADIVAPAWALDKRPVLERINKVLLERGTKQGCKFEGQAAFAMH
ncbi:MAG TPA: TIGR01212 family radical SAM protein [Oculatellaceae cyanobacterium]